MASDKNNFLKKTLPASLSHLLGLITSMTPAQKRAFKRDSGFWTSREKGLLYIALFDIISKFANRKEKQDIDLIPFIRQQNPELSKQNLSAYASYLYDRILQSMRFVASGSKTFKDLNGLMQDIHFLYNKSLLQACLLKIEEAKKLALEIDRPAYLLEITNVERRILPLINPPNLSDRFDAINSLYKDSSDILKQHNDVYILLYNNWKFISQNTPFSKVHDLMFQNLEQEYEAVIQYSNHPRLKLACLTAFERKNAGDFNFKLINQNVFTKKDKHLKTQIVALLSQYPCLQEDDYPGYLNIMSLYLISLLKENKLDEANTVLERLETTDDEYFRCQTLAFVRLQILNEKKEFKAGYEYLQTYNIAHYLNIYQSQISPTRLMAMWFLGAYIVLALERYKDLTIWANQLIKSPDFSIRFELRLSGHLFYTAAFYELNPSKNTEAADLLDQMMRRVRLKKIELTPAQMTVLKDIKSLFSKYFLEPRNRDTLKTWAEQAESIRKACHTTPMMSSFIVPLAWLLSKLKGTTIIQELN